jgi:hypothetical protein
MWRYKTSGGKIYLQLTTEQKRAFSGEVTSVGPTWKGQKIGIVAEKTIGSGMAEAVSQPCRP